MKTIAVLFLVFSVSVFAVEEVPDDKLAQALALLEGATDAESLALKARIEGEQRIRAAERTAEDARNLAAASIINQARQQREQQEPEQQPKQQKQKKQQKQQQQQQQQVQNDSQLQDPGAGAVGGSTGGGGGGYGGGNTNSSKSGESAMKVEAPKIETAPAAKPVDLLSSAKPIETAPIVPTAPAPLPRAPLAPIRVERYDAAVSVLDTSAFVAAKGNATPRVTARSRLMYAGGGRNPNAAPLVTPRAAVPMRSIAAGSNRAVRQSPRAAPAAKKAPVVVDNDAAEDEEDSVGHVQ